MLSGGTAGYWWLQWGSESRKLIRTTGLVTFSSPGRDTSVVPTSGGKAGALLSEVSTAPSASHHCFSVGTRSMYARTVESKENLPSPAPKLRPNPWLFLGELLSERQQTPLALCIFFGVLREMLKNSQVRYMAELIATRRERPGIPPPL